MKSKATNNDFSFKIIKELGILKEGNAPDGWDKIAAIVSWNEGEPKLDIRSWNSDRTRMSKGVSLDQEEIDKLREIIEELDDISEFDYSSDEE